MNLLYKVTLSLILCFAPFLSRAGNLWHRADNDKIPAARLGTSTGYLMYSLDEPPLKQQLFALSADPTGAGIVELPLPDGTFRYFKVWQSSLLPPTLAAKYPELRTFTAEAVDDRNVTAKLDFTSFGFHAAIFDHNNVSFIDPADNTSSGYYKVHYKKDEHRTSAQKSACLVTAEQVENAHASERIRPLTNARVTNGYQLRTYRLALSCDHQYAKAATGLSNPTVAQTFSKMITTVNRINGVYERELSVTMNFVANEDTLIWTDTMVNMSGPDPFGTIDGDAGSCTFTNQQECDALIGNANYDIGHVFTTGAGGLSQEGVVCVSGQKAESVTGQPDPVGDGFDIDYVSHEMGHEFGALHPFNNGMDGSCCCGNLVAECAYEPGSGSTIMAYAGICSPDDLQPHSDAYFHSVSLQQIQNYITTVGDACAVKTATNNKPVALPAFTASYSIPFLTPFELTAPIAVDSLADTSTLYCWEQWNLGDVGMEFINTHDAGPIFRSFFPVASPTRIFPNDSMVLAGVLSNAGTEGHEGEKAPDMARYLTFKLTVRDIYQGTGSFLIPDDSIHLDVINTGAGFKVTSQTIPGAIYAGNTNQTVTWDVVSTNEAPINASSVDIFMSTDGGHTWADTLGTFPNNGSAIVTLPNPDSVISFARIKVKGSGNVFFNVNSTDFKVVPYTGSVVTIESINIFPVPANSTLTITTNTIVPVQFVVYNAIGQSVWRGLITGQDVLPVSQWARGIYFVWAADGVGKHIIKKIVLD